MLNKLNKPLSALVILLGVYNFFFWKEKFGLNIIIFSLLIIIFLIWINPASLKSRNVILSILSVIYCSFMVFFNNTIFSSFTLLISLMVLTGFTHQPQTRSLFASFFTYAVSHFMIPVTVIDGFIKTRQQNKVLRIFYNVIKLGVIPVLFFCVFYALYAAASPKFSYYSANIFDQLNDIFYNVFKDYPFIRFMYLFMGFILLSAVLYNKNISFFKQYDLLYLERIFHDKTLKLVWLNNNKKYFSSFRIFKPRMNSLLTEHKIGIILLVLMNLLLLGLNIVDIKFLWLNFDPAEISGLSNYVHEGTYTLIFSIVLSMVILLFYFRGNLNFYKKNKVLKILSLAWIAQNAFMALSVALRDYYYIIYMHAISYKRIGVIVYLVLTLIGLVTLVLKITQKRSAYNILKINSLVVFIVFIIMSTFNWDLMIADYNLSNTNKDSIDIMYLLSLDDDVLPLLDQNQDLMKDKIIKPKIGRTINVLDEFYNRKYSFMKEQESFSWLSWNLPDSKTNQYLRNSGNINIY